jgi:hypothetical protein
MARVHRPVYCSCLAVPIAVRTTDTRALRSQCIWGGGGGANQRGEIGYAIWGTEIFNVGHKGA